MNSEIDLSSAEYQEPRNSLSTDFTTIEEEPVATSTPDRTTAVIGVRRRVSVAIDSPFLRRIPRSLAHIKGRQGAPSHPSSGYASPFLLRIPRKFEHVKGRPGIRMTRSLYQNASDTTSTIKTEASPKPPKNVSHEHVFEAEVIDEEVLGPAVEAFGSAVGVLGTTMTFLGAATGSEEQQVAEPQAEPEAENTADTKAGRLCSIS